MQPRTLAQWVGWVAVWVAAVALGPGNAALAQVAPSASAAAAETARAASTAGANSSSLSDIQSQFGALKLVAYVALGSGLVVGLLVFRKLRSGQIPLATTIGAACTAGVALLVFWLGSTFLLSADSAACGAALLETGSRAQLYDDLCREAREGAANAFGFVSAFRGLFLSAGEGFVVPVAGAMVKLLAHVSLLLTALVLYLLLRLVVLRGIRV